ncbi:MAG: hypothetical protein J6C11_02800 [Spirochaetaceae bacterium]|nr:hypothetical protein [Spirochaetaceae bacterium]
MNTSYRKKPCEKREHITIFQCLTQAVFLEIDGGNGHDGGQRQGKNWLHLPSSAPVLLA